MKQASAQSRQGKRARPGKSSRWPCPGCKRVWTGGAKAGGVLCGRCAKEAAAR